MIKCWQFHSGPHFDSDILFLLYAAHWSFEGGGVGSLVHGAVLQGRRYEARLEIWADGLRMTLEDPYTDGCTLTIRRGIYSGTSD